MQDNTIFGQYMPSTVECQKLCELTTNCSYFTYNSQTYRCFMKSSDVGRKYAGNEYLSYVVSGPKYCDRKGKLLNKRLKNTD